MNRVTCITMSLVLFSSCCQCWLTSSAAVNARALTDGWHRGPITVKTYHYGAVVLKNDNPAAGFYFADFRGDHVIVRKGNDSVRVENENIGYWNNSILYPVLVPVPEWVEQLAGD